MRSSMKAAAVTAAALPLVIALPLLVTACSSASSPAASSSTASGSAVSTSSAASSTASSGAATSSGSSSGDPLASLTADQIASKANDDLKTASSYRLSGSITTSGSTETVKLSRGAGKCAGTISVGNQPITFVQIGATEWIRLGSGGDYLKTTSGNSSYKQDLSYCDPSQIAELVNPMIGHLTKGATTTVDGKQVQKLALSNVITIDVTISATPQYVRFVDKVNSTDERLDFSGINAPVSINPPPASQVLGA
jgi:hypothetical protein